MVRFGTCGRRDCGEQYFAARHRETDFIDYLTRNAGFISVKPMGRSFSVRAAPSAVQMATYMKLSTLLPDDLHCVSLSIFDGGWTQQIIPGRDQALKRLMMFMGRMRRLQTDRYRSAIHSVERTPLFDCHDQLLDLWRANGGQLDPETVREALNEITRGKFAVIDRDPDTSHLVFATIGDGIGVYRDPSWRQFSNGGRVEDQPDIRYGQWIAGSYRETLLERAPKLASIDARVVDPKSGGDHRIRYARLTLPFTAPDGRWKLLSASVEDLDIDLSAVEVH